MLLVRSYETKRPAPNIDSLYSTVFFVINTSCQSASIPRILRASCNQKEIIVPLSLPKMLLL